jgi:FMN phosphatase YigB (HAD superfamily)
MVKKVVLDFDGTLTDVWKEEDVFYDSFKESLAKALDRDPQHINLSWNELKATIEEHPQSFGWRPTDVIVAPAYADPYVLSTTIGQEIVRVAKGNLTGPDLQKVLYPIFAEAYSKLGSHFVEGAKEVLGELMQNYQVTIITNSKPEAVRAKLEKINCDMINVVGNAAKFILDPNFSGVEACVDCEPLGRKIHLNRKQYYDRLTEVMGDSKPEDVLVAGDIYEMDLALPAYMGMKTVLVTSKRTHGLEKEVASRDCKIAYSLRQLPAIVDHLLYARNE